jgi:DUF4097 and DUF4098 domain-containing protein YvlB
MKQKVKVVFFIMLLMFALLPAEEYEQKINRSFALAAGDAIELANVNGVIAITSGTGPTVEIKAVKRSDYEGAIENVDVLFETRSGGLRVTVKYSKKNAKAKVDFTVVVPENLAKAEFQSVNGKIDCTGKFADLMLKTVNGRIDFQGRFQAGKFETVNGVIDVSQEAPLGGDLQATTVNGAIEIELNGKSAFEVQGQTVNGSIETDFDVSISRHVVGRSVSGKVNGGGRKVEVETVNGSIHISKI